jgi:hypothetical protein
MNIGDSTSLIGTTTFCCIYLCFFSQLSFKIRISVESWNWLNLNIIEYVSENTLNLGYKRCKILAEYMSHFISGILIAHSFHFFNQ